MPPGFELKTTSSASKGPNAWWQKSRPINVPSAHRRWGSLKPAAWHLGIDLAVQSQELQCFCHAVEQIPSAGRGRTAQFVPIRFLFRNKLSRDDKVLLAFDARVLSEVLSRAVGLGKIVHGENYVTLKVKTSALASDVRKVTDKIGTLLASPSPPDLVLNRHCAECEFQNRCRQKGIEKDDLSLLSGMAEKERTDFNAKRSRRSWPTLMCLDIS